jgi:hypothetical protein
MVNLKIDYLSIYPILDYLLGWVIMISYMLVLYPNQRTWWELLYGTMNHYDYDYEIVEF